MFSWYKCLIVNLVFSHLGFWIFSFFIVPFPDRCLLVPFFPSNGFYFRQCGIWKNPYCKLSCMHVRPGQHTNTMQIDLTISLYIKLFEKAVKTQVAKPDSRHRVIEESMNVKHASETSTPTIDWPCYKDA